MRRNTLLAILSATLLVVPVHATGPAALQGKPGSGAKPNIIFIMLDDVDYFDLASYGNDISTPATDFMADNGMRLTNYYVNGPICPQTRNALQTGQYQSRLGIKRTSTDSYRGIPANVPTIAQALREEGYRTAHFGKWHVGHRHEEFKPLQKGYDTAVVGWDYAGSIDPSYEEPHFIIDDRKHVYLTQFATEALTDYTLSFIEQNQESPFFVNLWYFAPHLPLTCPPDTECVEGSPDLVKYRSMIMFADQQIGRIIDRVDDLGLAETTLIIVSSDNGGYAANGTQPDLPPGVDMQGHKTRVFERGIKVPFLALWPETICPGLENDSLVVGFDMFPTFVELATGEPSTIFSDGKSIVPVLTQDADVPRPETIFWEFKHRDHDSYCPSTGWYNNFAVRRGEWKLVMEKNHSWRNARLFNLVDDPGERTNQSGSQSALVDELMAEYWDWRESKSKLEYAIAATSGGVVVDGQNFDFQSAGVAIMEEDVRFDFGNADFSLSARIRRDGLGLGPVIASKPGSWALRVNGSNRLELEATAEDLGETTVITSEAPLVLGQEYDIAVTFYGFRSHNTTISLFVDGELQGSSDALQAVRVVAEPIRIGNNLAEDRPFLGEIHALNLRINSLTQEEVNALRGVDVVAKAGCDKEVELGAVVTLNGRSSTGPIVSYRWELVSGHGGIIFDGDSAVATAYLPDWVQDPGPHDVVYRLTVESLSSSSSDEVIVHVNGDGGPPPS